METRRGGGMEKSEKALGEEITEETSKYQSGWVGGFGDLTSLWRRRELDSSFFRWVERGHVDGNGLRFN